ncbi:MAG TPA: flagellar biosynthetic protein FliO [Kofleriaceae bacterium]
MVTSLLVLGAVCIAAFVAVRVFGRLLATGRTRGTHLLDVVARVPLEPRRSLYVVEVAGKTLLVGTSEMGLSVLSELDGSEVKSRVQAQQSFGDLVRAAWHRRKGRAAAPATSESAATESRGVAATESAVTRERTHMGTETAAREHTHVGTETESAGERTHVGTETESARERTHVGTETESAREHNHVGTESEQAHVGAARAAHKPITSPAPTSEG